MQDNVNIITISDNPHTLEVLNLYIKDFEHLALTGSFSDTIQALNSIEKNDNLIIVLDVNKNTDKSLDFVFKVTRQNPLRKIIALFDEGNVDLMVKFVRAGVYEFVSTPVIKTEFMNVIMRIYREIQEKAVVNQTAKCKVISVFSNKGGIGKTSIASNLALELAQISKEKVALLDFNFQLGDITTFMDLKPTFDISYFLQNLDNLNEDFLLGTLEQYKQTSLYVLADPPYLKQADIITPKQITGLLKVLKKTFSYIVIDTEASFDDKNIVALTESDVIFLITIANLPALRNTQRCLEIFDKLGLDENKIKIILNRYMENDEVGIKDVERVIGQTIYEKIPNNYFTIMSSVNKGIPVSIAKPDSNLAKSYNELAQQLSDDLLKNNLTKQYSNVLKQEVL